MGYEVELLLSHVVALEECFNSRPGDVAEQRLRDELIRYVLLPPQVLVLSFSQRVGTHTRTTDVVVREPRAAATYWSCS